MEKEMTNAIGRTRAKSLSNRLEFFIMKAVLVWQNQQPYFI
jgi:hypothetical protein